MEPPIKSSFIPKRPVAPVTMRRAPSRSLGILFAGASVLLVAALLMAGGVFGYEQLLKRSIADKQAQLAKVKGELLHESSMEAINELRRADTRIRKVKEILEKHVTISPVFKMLQESTLRNVQFTNFKYTFNPEGNVTVEMQGKALNFRSLALQSDSLTNNPTYRDVNFSNLTVDDIGNVAFSLSFDLDADAVFYKNLVVGNELPALEIFSPAATSTASSSKP